MNSFKNNIEDNIFNQDVQEWSQQYFLFGGPSYDMDTLIKTN